MYWVRIKTGKYKDYLGIVHEADIRTYRNLKGKIVTIVQVEAPQDNFPFKDYTNSQIERVDNPNER